MGGHPKDIHCKEWNIFCDPEAARIVYSSSVRLYAVGLNVTMQVKLEEKHREKLKQVDGERFSLLSNMMEKWFEHYEFACPVMHDPLAISTLFTDVCTFSFEPIYVGLEGEERAVTKLDKRGNEICYADSVDTDKFFHYFIKTIFDIG